jgi:hypothetical protein
MPRRRFDLNYSEDGVPDFTANEENMEANCIGGMIQIRKFPTGIKVHQEECHRRKGKPLRAGHSVVCSMLCGLYPKELETLGDIEQWNREGSRIWVDQYRLKPSRVGVQEED